MKLQPKQIILPPKNGRYPSVWLLDMGNSCTSVFPNTCAWGQKECSKTKKQTKKVRKEA